MRLGSSLITPCLFNRKCQYSRKGKCLQTRLNNKHLLGTYYLINYESRDYEGLDLVLKRNENLLFELSEVESDDLNYNILTFLNYAIKQKEFSFTMSEMTSKLNLQITPSVFGKLIKNNLAILEKEGLHIEKNRTSKERDYYAKYEEPTYENE